jgi:hypothetical protein
MADNKGVKKSKKKPKLRISESSTYVSQEDKSSSEIVIKKKGKTKKTELAGTKNKTKKNNKE